MEKQPEVQALLLAFIGYQDDIHDFMQDFPPDLIKQSAEEMRDCFTNIQALRKKLKDNERELRFHIQENKEFLEAYEARYSKPYSTTINEVATYINTIRKQIYELETSSSKEILSVNSQKSTFVAEEVTRVIDYLNKIFTITIKTVSNDDLKLRKKQLQSRMSEVSTLSEKLKELIELNTSATVFDPIKKGYDKLYQSAQTYEETINDEISLRELDKLDSFKKVQLNIKLPKFIGYEAEIDIYTFISDFEKLYSDHVPKSLQPDFVKNNYLGNHALELVKNVNDIDEIWVRLKDAFGDRKLLLSQKLATLTSIDMKVKDSTKITESLSKIVNTMRDLMVLAATHNIENELYYGDALTHLSNKLGQSRLMRWLTYTCDHPREGKYKWKLLIEFLEKEIKIQQQMTVLQTNLNTNPSGKDKDGKDKDGKSKDGRNKGRGSSYYGQQPRQPQQPTCVVCGANDHIQTNGPKNSKLIQYFSCKRFAEMTAAQRLKFLNDNSLCHQCLYPGAKINTGKHSEGRCQQRFICPHPSHTTEKTKKHILVCDEHKLDQVNKDILEHYKDVCIRKHPLPNYSKDIKIYHSLFKSNHHQQVNDANNAIFMLQSISINKRTYTIFYDTGCSDFVSRFEAVKHLGSNAVKHSSHEIEMNGVGGSKNISKRGIYKVSIPLSHGSHAVMIGPCMDRITETFPQYPLQGKVYDDIKDGYIKEGNNIQFLPNVPKSIGGDVDFMIGMKYNRYFPEPIFQLPSGLTIYRSQFVNTDGSLGIIGGPHEVFNRIGSAHLSTHFVSSQLRLYQNGYDIDPDIRLLGYLSHVGDVFHSKSLDDAHESAINTFNEAERAGSEQTFRCVSCRGCTKCKNQPNEIMSIKEEIEQQIIDDSVTVDIENNQSIATLPLMSDPSRLSPNRGIALKVYNQQLHRLAKNTNDKDDIIKSEHKLQKLGYVDYVKNLPKEIQHSLAQSQFQNFIPWRAVWKESSVSTPCRVVFDASMPTESGFSLNDLLAKGRNNMNRLVDIFVRWRCHSVVFHTDVQKMYNSIKLHPSHWGLQRYLWQDQLDPTKPPEEKVIKTLIYGIKSSGNQAERGLRETARLFKEEYPQVNDIVSNDVYVDDCLSGETTVKITHEVADDLEVVISRGGFGLKGFTFSGQRPQESLSNDGETVSVAGLKWYPQEDEIALDVQQLNFAKKSRGRKPTLQSTIPKDLTRRQCVAKVAELYDITGLITPIVATMKLDLHDLVTRKMDWDDILPDNIRNLWIDHFELMDEIKNVRFKRAVIPDDAANLDIQTLEFGDASKHLICIAIYVRFQRTNGSHSCQLIFGRSKLISKEYTQPRAELFAAMVNAHSGHTIRQALKDKHKSSMRFTDSQITLYWICNDKLNLKQWTRNRVSEIHRFTDTNEWQYIKSGDMIADLGTRRCVSIEEINQNSSWIQGYPWMQEDESTFPAKTVKEISLNAQEKQHLKKESRDEDRKEVIDCFICSTKLTLPEAISERYTLSSYLVDPNSKRFHTVIRIMGYVFKYVYALRNKSYTKAKESLSNQLPILSDEDIKRSKDYFFKKASQEVKHFNPESKFKKISEEKDGILYYTGRILPTDQISTLGKATSTMKDLTASTFCVPLVDKNSPLAYSIIMDIHWNHPTAMHSGVETTWRYVLQQCYILEGRSLVKMVRSSCPRCRYLLKRKFNVIMGPLSEDNLKIAPAFYTTQTDLAGPFLSYSQHHKRTTVKIWLVVFCCATTTSTKIKVMDNYDTLAFLQAFTRLACEVGYPKKLLVDEGSQLIKACETMELNFVDIQQHLHSKLNIEFGTCPVGGHNVHGRVERKISEIKKSIEKSANKERLSILHWETLASTISNTINNLPLAVGNHKHFEMSDLLTPNRLLLGRNNDRSPTEPLSVSNDYDKMIRANKKIYDAWFECWLTAHVPNLMIQPKWFNNDTDIKPGDIVLFMKQESSLASTYQFGRVQNVNNGRDGKIREVDVEYVNNNEKTKRITHRSVRSLILIHGIDEIDITSQLYGLKN